MTNTAFVMRRWVKARNHPLADAAYRAAKGLRRVECPVVPGLHAALYALYRGLGAAGGTLRRVLWDTPLFKTRLSGPAPGLYLYGGLPLVPGAVRMTMGDGCRLSGQTTIAVGRRVVRRRVVLGDDVRVAGLPETEDQVGDILLEEGVWHATGITVSAGVRIGRGAVVAAGSVVTGDLPPMVLAGGVSARVIRRLAADGARTAKGGAPA